MGLKLNGEVSLDQVANSINVLSEPELENLSKYLNWRVMGHHLGLVSEIDQVDFLEEFAETLDAEAEPTRSKKIEYILANFSDETKDLFRELIKGKREKGTEDKIEGSNNEISFSEILLYYAAEVNNSLYYCTPKFQEIKLFQIGTELWYSLQDYLPYSQQKGYLDNVFPAISEIVRILKNSEVQHMDSISNIPIKLREISREVEEDEGKEYWADDDEIDNYNLDDGEQQGKA